VGRREGGKEGRRRPGVWREVDVRKILLTERVQARYGW
jgi:hypothetical protein